MTRDTYLNPMPAAKLMPVDVPVKEFFDFAVLHGWHPKTIKLLLNPPVMASAFKVGKYLVKLK